MAIRRYFSVILLGFALASLTACSGGGLLGKGSNGRTAPGVQGQSARETQQAGGGTRIWDLFSNVDDPNTTVQVNKYLWDATLDVLKFLPVEAADPFTGIIVYGYGKPPGGGRAYKATVYISDPALDARALRVALMTRGGPASSAATQAIEDAILTRARQLRIADGKL
ncbi:MAG TPA: DUF3576 domain-containing protein [Rhodobacterales bacterium]|nr:DUF3576 domain-containing protein [Rhodobacterales bacterium]